MPVVGPSRHLLHPHNKGRHRSEANIAEFDK
jgi:hypothetical protein